MAIQRVAKCPNPAVNSVTWGKRFLVACAAHTEDLKKISSILGEEIEITPVITTKRCFGAGYVPEKKAPSEERTN